jgi:2-methylisocitrate lyase-like PEP mutase family enzyme
VLWLRTSNPSDTAFRVLRVIRRRVHGGCHRGSEIQAWSGTYAGASSYIRDFVDAVARVKAVAKVAKGRILLTGWTDNFIQGRPDLDDTIKRLTAFAEVGADVLYAPVSGEHGRSSCYRPRGRA